MFDSTCFMFFLILSLFTFNSMNPRFNNKFAINFVLSINCNMKMYFLNNFFPTFINYYNFFSIGIIKVIYFPVFSGKQVHCFLSSSADSFMIKC